MPDANPDVQLSVGDASYTLRFSLKAFARLQDHFGLKSIDAVGKRMADPSQFAIEDVGALLWAGLARRHPEVTLEQAMDIADDLGIAALMEQLLGAFGAALDDTKADGKPRPSRSPGPSTATSRSRRKRG